MFAFACLTSSPPAFQHCTGERRGGCVPFVSIILSNHCQKTQCNLPLAQHVNVSQCYYSIAARVLNIRTCISKDLCPHSRRQPGRHGFAYCRRCECCWHKASSDMILKTHYAAINHYRFLANMKRRATRARRQNGINGTKTNNGNNNNNPVYKRHRLDTSNRIWNSERRREVRLSKHFRHSIECKPNTAAHTYARIKAKGVTARKTCGGWGSLMIFHGFNALFDGITRPHRPPARNAIPFIAYLVESERANAVLSHW